MMDCEFWSWHYPRPGKLRENLFLNELHEEKPNFQNRDFADSIKCQSDNIAYIPSVPNAHGVLLLTKKIRMIWSKLDSEQQRLS